MTKVTEHVVVIGAGIAGLWMARALLAHGYRVTIVDRRLPFREASAAAAGILGAFAATDTKPLLAGATEAYARLQAEDPGAQWLDRGGFYDLRDAATTAPPAAVRATWHAWGVCAERATHHPDIAQVAPAAMGRALVASLVRHPHCTLRQERVLGLCAEPLRLYTSGGTLVAAHLVLCAGCGTTALMRTLQLPPLVVLPRKGQLLGWRRSPATPPAATGICLSWGKDYLVVRASGALLYGSTVEDAGFDPCPTATGKRALCARLASRAPLLAAQPPDEHWAGLRPYTPDGLPYLGRLPDTRSLWINAGHFREGIAMAPACARLLAASIAGAVDPAMAPYDPCRTLPGAASDSEPPFSRI